MGVCLDGTILANIFWNYLGERAGEGRMGDLSLGAGRSKWCIYDGIIGAITIY